MKTLSLKMNFSATDDKAFFGISALLGTITEYKNIATASLLDQTFINSLASAATLAFVSGFIGLFAKKFAEYIYKKITKDKSTELM